MLGTTILMARLGDTLRISAELCLSRVELLLGKQVFTWPCKMSSEVGCIVLLIVASKIVSRFRSDPVLKFGVRWVP